ncbi:outer membrane protein assembly factor BamD [Putridiphycobacter roseus]|uniref:Outer membrane protein assembly factor BamD n=1 Tax=Putridiphycobacter roseus TaxID=2219161 RepID=A0A2W1NNK5_9FLAO|nr:outer membrane protein assembly factor BamD [Putridiphycobacter roseus]PZE16178.1 outer membrane protein assembly factor BamD [Putridiphycobacter roseus]
MKQKSVKIILVFAFIVSLTACSDFNKVMKSEDQVFKKKRAIEYYETKQYENSAAVLEDIIPYFKLSADGEKLYYYYCMSNYYLDDYYLASYYFRRFINQYPSSVHAEECQFLSAICSVNNSPDYSLDQTETLNALDQLQIFIDMHPKSSLIDSCNKIMDKLNYKIETKQFESAKLYYKTENYKAALTAFEIHLADFPGTRYREETMYLLVKSSYLLAINSIESKKMKRFNETTKTYRKFVSQFPNSKYVKELSVLNKKVEKIINGQNS